jgi:formamidopyrimidine-DNA glycosylase
LKALIGWSFIGWSRVDWPGRRPARRPEDEQWERLLHATVEVLSTWTDRLRPEAGEFPAKVAAFRPEMAVHGRFGAPCPRCAAAVQQIGHAANEVNDCAPCRTGGRLLADHALSRLLNEDWRRLVAGMEERKRKGRARGATLP